MSRLRYRLRKLALPRRRRARVKGLAPAALLLAALLMLLIIVRLTPTVREMAVAAARNSVTATVNAAVGDLMSEGELRYGSLISFEKDEQGRVTALVCDMVRANRLKTRITSDVIDALSSSRGTDIGIPVGNLIGGSLLSGKGPKIPVRIISVSSVETDFKNAFSASGINQTRHRLMISVDVQVDVMVPGRVMRTGVSTTVAVAESVIVGSVPESYTYFEGDEKWDENVERYDIMS